MYHADEKCTITYKKCIIVREKDIEILVKNKVLLMKNVSMLVKNIWMHTIRKTYSNACEKCMRLRKIMFMNNVSMC